MIHRLSYLVYGGQPRRILHCSSDVAEDERQAMMRWCGDLKPLGPYDEFISAGGISWVDVPTSTGRRLFVRVFATRGQSRDAWYFLGLILAEEDYAAIADYGRLVSFVESFSVASLLAERMTGSKVSIPIDRNAGASNEMPPLFRQTTDPDWTSAAWIQSRAKKTQHLSGGQLHIAFNPPAARGEYTTLLISEGFVKPGLKLKPILEDDHGPNHSGENKKLLAIMKTPILLSLLVPAFAFGYLSKSSTAPSDLFPVATVTATDGGPLLPTIRLPRSAGSFVLSVDGGDSNLDEIEVRSNANWIEVGPPAVVPSGAVEYSCTLKLGENSSSGAALFALLTVVMNDEVVFEQLVEIEAADMSISFFDSHGLDGESSTNLGSIGGFMYARLGIASVVVNGALAELEMSPDETVGEWRLAVNEWPQAASVTITDRAGNQVTTTKHLISGLSDPGAQLKKESNQ